VEFCFMRAGKWMVATGTFALLVDLGATPMARAQAAGQATTGQAAGQAGGQATGQAGGQAAGGQAAGQPGAKNYKDREEYELYSKITQTTDPQAKLTLLQTWQDKYPQSDFAQDRLQLFINTLATQAGKDPAARQKLIEKSNEMLKKDPKFFLANYYITYYMPAIGGANPTPDQISQAETAAKGVIEGAETAFDPAKKPASVSAEQFAKLKGQSVATAHNTLAWAANAKKDNATVESEYKASLQANPEQANISAQYGRMLVGEKKYPEGLFEYARAAQYDGPGALPAATRQQLMDYFNKAYKDFHGSDEGKDQMLAQAKTQPLPPEGLQLTSAADLANKQADALNSRINSDPAFKVWYAVKQNTQDKGDAFFNEEVKGYELPGESVPSKTFSGTVISVDPSKVTLGIEDPTKPDATLEFSQPLPAAAMDKVKVGEKLDFSGIADAYVKDPYMLTFKDPTIPGVQTAAPARKGKAGKKR
jgi:hypothetical protein